MKNKNKLLLVLLFGGLALFTAANTLAANKLNLFFFTGDNCADCKIIETKLQTLKLEYPSLSITPIVIEPQNPINDDYFTRFSVAFGVRTSQLPQIYVSDKAFIGAEMTGLTDIIRSCTTATCKDSIEVINRYYQDKVTIEKTKNLKDKSITISPWLYALGLVLAFAGYFYYHIFIKPPR